ncbi:MAG: hypothetical protein GC161_04115 [Planctomycetaceae bacterium]|nr:hypothetical protein [Planctomycetaceae bacterium]
MNTPENHPFDPCAALGERIRAGELDAPEVRGHLETCEACAELAQRARRLQGALGQLRRSAAPAALDGLVASALGRRPVERLLGQLGRVAAPAVLDRLVAEEIAAPELHTIRRTMDGLPRLTAPADAEVVIGRKLSRWVLLRRAGQPGGLTRSALGGLLAAGVVGLIWIGWQAGPDRTSVRSEVLAQGARERPPLRLKAVAVVSPDRLDPVAQAFLTGLGGGAPLASPSVPR